LLNASLFALLLRVALNEWFALWKFDDDGILAFCLRVITFFPSEHRQGVALAARLGRTRDPGAGLRFLLLQVAKIRVIRQSSSNAAAAERLREMRELRDRLVQRHVEILSAATEAYPTYLRLDWEVSAAWAKSNQIAADYPNSMQHAEALLDFEIECATDYCAAIKQRHRMDELEAGHSFAVDHCFRSMVQMLPFFLKEKLLTNAGVVIALKPRDGTSAGSSASAHARGSASGSGAMAEASFGTSSSGLDPAVEEQIGRALLVGWRTRVAVQQCLSDRSMSSLAFANVGQTLFALVGLAVSLLGFLLFRSRFDGHKGSLFQQRTQAQAHLTLIEAALELTLGQAEWLGRLSLGWPLLASTDELATAELPFEDFDAFAQGFAIEAEAEMHRFLGDLVRMREGSSRVRENYPMVFDPIVPFDICHDGAPVPGVGGVERLAMLANLFAYGVVNVLTLRGADALQWWGRTNAADSEPESTVPTTFCEFVRLIPAISDGMMNLRSASTRVSDEEIASNRRLFSLLIYAAPSVYGVVLLGLFLMVVVPIVLELNRVAQALSSVPEAGKERGMQAIRVGGEVRSLTGAGVKHARSDPVFVALSVLVVVALLGQVSLTLYDGFVLRQTNEVMHAINSQLNQAHHITPLLVELALRVVTIDLLPGSAGFHEDEPFAAPSATLATTDEAQRARLNALHRLAQEVLETLSSDAESGESMLGLDAETDSLLLEEQCERNPAMPTRHETYRCSGMIALINMMLESLASLEAQPVPATVSGDELSNLLHMLSFHFIALSDRLWARVGDTFPEARLRSYSATLRNIFIGELAVLTVSMSLMFGLRATGLWAFEGMKLSLRRLAPETIISHTPLLNYILDVEEKETHMSTTRQIINNAGDGILATDSALLIESVNQGAQKVLGFSPEQLLGQDVRLIFAEEFGEKVARQWQTMRGRDAPRTFVMSVNCVSESGETVPVVLTMLALAGHRKSDIATLVVTLRDVSALQALQAEASKTKARSEQLLYEILPRDIVTRLNQGETEVSFAVQSATLAFLDIVRFSDFAALLSPQETLHALSHIFDGYDKAIEKYDLCLKMKFVGDVYMVAAGLFAPGSEPSQHAGQTVHFGLDCLEVIDEANHVLDANLSVRIGVNTGGPLTAGVLGVDKPLFDILGDPINVAARLQSTAPPGRVQVSEGTHALICESADLVIEPRGEVMLKGKGMRPAFLVSAKQACTTSFGFQFGGSSSAVLGQRSRSGAVLGQGSRLGAVPGQGSRSNARSTAAAAPGGRMAPPELSQLLGDA
jgi:PAS domain S-box-containing protein